MLCLCVAVEPLRLLLLLCCCVHHRSSILSLFRSFPPVARLSLSLSPPLLRYLVSLLDLYVLIYLCCFTIHELFFVFLLTSFLCTDAVPSHTPPPPVCLCVAAAEAVSSPICFRVSAVSSVSS